MMETPIDTSTPRIPSELTSVCVLYVGMLEDCIPDPLSERITVAAVLSDILELAGEPVPDWIAERLDGRQIIH